MRHIYIFLAALLLNACTANLGPVTFDEGLASFLGTRSDAPLEGTVWEHQTGEKYNRYVSLRNGEMSVFYRSMFQDTLCRYSDFFTAPYALKGGLIITDLSYPLWGHKEVTESVSVFEYKSWYTIGLDGEDYHYYGPYTKDLEELWMSITVNIVPWD